MMDVPERLWDSSVVLSYLLGDPNVKQELELIIQQGQRHQILLNVSAMAQSEVAFLPGYTDADAENKVREFFSRDYVKTILYDIEVARQSRSLIRKYRSELLDAQSLRCPKCNRKITQGLKAPDAVHMASALLWHIPILETYDTDLLKLNGKEGNPPIIIRQPLYEGITPLPLDFARTERLSAQNPPNAN